MGKGRQGSGSISGNWAYIGLELGQEGPWIDSFSDLLWKKERGESRGISFGGPNWVTRRRFREALLLRRLPSEGCAKMKGEKGECKKKGLPRHVGASGVRSCRKEGM